MLYVFAGFPRCNLSAAGLRQFVNLEEIGILDESPQHQYQKEGMFIVTPTGAEWQSDVHCRLSLNCWQDFVYWRWFPENWSFGNGVTVHKTTVHYERRLIATETDNGRVDLRITRLDPTAYAERWPPGCYPRENHAVHLTWLAFEHPLPDHAYRRLREAVEDSGFALRDPQKYGEEHFSATRPLLFSKLLATVEGQ